MEKIGEGGDGEYFKILNKKDNNYYCLKRFHKVQDGINEAEISKLFNHENIVKFYDAFQDKKTFNIIMEFCEYSNLKAFINEHKENKELIDSNVIYCVMLDICLGLKNIHSKNVIHRNLNPRNILIGKDYKVKIEVSSLSKPYKDGNKDDTYDKYSKEGFRVPYMAPEILKGEKYTNKVDIWALGCILYELWTLNVFFDDVKGLGNYILFKGIDKTKMIQYDKELINLIDLLLNAEQSQRPDIKEVSKILCNYGKRDFILEEKLLNSLDKISYNIIKINLKYKKTESEELKDLLQNDYKGLKELYLRKKNLSDIKVLEKVKSEQLEILNLSINKITNIDLLEKVNFKELKELDISDNDISHIEVLEEVKFEKLEN